MNKNSRYSPGQTGRKRPLSWWHTIHPGLRAAFVSFWVIVLLFGCSGLGVPRVLGTWGGLVFYGLQFLVYVGNGFLAGVQSSETRSMATRSVGYKEDRGVRRSSPPYVLDGFVAGLALGALLLLLQLVLGAVVVSNLPSGMTLDTIVGESVPLRLLVDFALSVLGGIVGGFVYRQTR